MLRERQEQIPDVLACRLASLPEACSCAVCGEVIPARHQHWRVSVMLDREVVVRRVHRRSECAGVQVEARREAA